MKIGILNAIDPDSSKINWGGTPVDAYIRFFKRAGAPFEFVGYNVAQGEFPDRPEACDGYIITGSPKGVYDDDQWIEQLAQFIRDSYQARKKLVGICFGHQILAHSLGGHAEKSEKGRGFGLKQFDVIKKRPWMDAQPDQCSLYFAHQDQVTTLPPEAELLGGNGFCPTVLYEIENQVLGIQGHPEFTLNIMQDIVGLLEGNMEPELLQTAVSSLNDTPDNDAVGHWIVNFFSG
jgi:GMP synthase-like glutamine amidotransferase